MRTVLAVVLILLLAGGVMAQELIMEKSPSDIVIFGNEQGLFVREVWPIMLEQGQNDLRWQKPVETRLEDVSVQVEGAILSTILSPLDTQDHTMTLVAEEEGPGQLVLTYPLSGVTLTFLYQFDWDTDQSAPRGTLYAELRNQSAQVWTATRFVLGGVERELDLGPHQTSRIALQEIEPESAERYSRYDRRLFGDTDVRFFWNIQIPEEMAFPGKVECFEQSTAGVVFLGEGSYQADSQEMDLLVGVGTDLVVEETILHRKKVNQVISKRGWEVLYDTEETKRYTVSNRGSEKRILELHDTLRPGYELVRTSHPLIRQEADRIVFRLTLEPQEEIEVLVEVQGIHLTSGYIF